MAIKRDKDGNIVDFTVHPDIAKSGISFDQVRFVKTSDTGSDEAEEPPGSQASESDD